MLLLLAALVLVSAGILIVGYLRKQDRQLKIASAPVRDLSTTRLRPLFASNELDNAGPKGETRFRAARQRVLTEEATLSRAADLRSALEHLGAAPSRDSILMILESTAEFGDAEIFSFAAERVIAAFRRGETDLTAGNVAALLDSHYRLLPAEARSSGELFWLKREIAELSRTGRPS